LALFFPLIFYYLQQIPSYLYFYSHIHSNPLITPFHVYFLHQPFYFLILISYFILALFIHLLHEIRYDHDVLKIFHYLTSHWNLTVNFYGLLLIRFHYLVILKSFSYSYFRQPFNYFKAIKLDFYSYSMSYLLITFNDLY